jgi:hypothetical protein
MTKEEIIKLRKEKPTDEQAKKLHQQLVRIYKKEYKPKHNASTYLKLILDWDVHEFEEIIKTDNTCHEYVYEVFSCVSQSVYGYTKEHCLDQIYDDVVAKKKRIKEYKELPTLKELVYSDIEIDPKKMYKTKEKGTYEDSCCGRDGGSILRMREIGIDEFCREEWNKWFPHLRLNK